MVRIAITPAAFEAIAATLPFGSVAFKPTITPGAIWVEPRVLNRLAALRAPRRELQRRPRRRLAARIRGASRLRISCGAPARKTPLDALEGLDDLSERPLDEVETTLNVRRAVAIGLGHRPGLLIGERRGPLDVDR